MIVLDIDQDYFFLPVISHRIIPEAIERGRFFYEADIQPDDLLKKFHVENFKGTFACNSDHDHVYHFLKSSGLKGFKLIHIDAHDDINHGPFRPQVDIGNWITHGVIEGIFDPDIIWIDQRHQSPHTYYYKHENVEYRVHASQLKDFQFNNKVDVVCYTRSNEFCPPNFKEKEIIRLLNLRP